MRIYISNHSRQNMYIFYDILFMDFFIYVLYTTYAAERRRDELSNQMRGVLIGAVVTLFFLIGGFFAYQWWFVAKPLEQLLQNVDGLEVKQLKVTPQEVKLEMTIDPNKYSVPDDFPSHRQKISSITGDRMLSISFVESKTPEMEAAWRELMFGVQEGLRQGAYTKIPHSVHQVAKRYGFDARTTMDDEYVYIQLTNGNHLMVRLFPIVNEEGEVKTNA